jgi:hypothetical protein
VFGPDTDSPANESRHRRRISGVTIDGLIRIIGDGKRDRAQDEEHHELVVVDEGDDLRLGEQQQIGKRTAAIGIQVDSNGQTDEPIDRARAREF